ncbi:MAG: hypothetical protein ACLR2G_00545 [Phascolarctobacterium faecium]
MAAELLTNWTALAFALQLWRKSDNVKINAQIRAHYQSHDKGHSGEWNKKTNATSKLRSRIWINGQINEDWKYVGMLQNEQDLLTMKAMKALIFNALSLLVVSAV